MKKKQQKEKKKLTKHDEFYLLHVIREEMLKVGYDENHPSLKPIREFLEESYGKDLVKKKIEHVKTFLEGFTYKVDARKQLENLKKSYNVKR